MTDWLQYTQEGRAVLFVAFLAVGLGITYLIVRKDGK